MNETLYRWQGRIGSLKPLALIVLIIILIFVVPTINNLWIAFKNPSTSQSVSVDQLVSGAVGTGKYISVSGTASYELAYTEKTDGKLTALYYPLIDANSNRIIFVKTTDTTLENAKDADVTISGMTAGSDSDLKNVIEKDLADINSAGFETSSALYIEEGRTPGNFLIYLLELGALGFIGLLCALTFFFPSVVFKPFPVQTNVADPNVKSAFKTTGTFQQVTKLEPLTFGKQRRKFENANSNLFFMQDRSIGVYIHFVFTQRVYGVQVRKTETDWMILVQPSQIISVEPGKIYSWRDTWAVAVRYKENDKNQVLTVAFDNAAAQANYINVLRDKDYAVSSGQCAVTGSTWS